MINNHQNAMQIARFSIKYVLESLFVHKLVIGGKNALLQS